MPTVVNDCFVGSSILYLFEQVKSTIEYAKRLKESMNTSIYYVLPHTYCMFWNMNIYILNAVCVCESQLSDSQLTKRPTSQANYTRVCYTSVGVEWEAEGTERNTRNCARLCTYAILSLILFYVGRVDGLNKSECVLFGCVCVVFCDSWYVWNIKQVEKSRHILPTIW